MLFGLLFNHMPFHVCLCAFRMFFHMNILFRMICSALLINVDLAQYFLILPFSHWQMPTHFAMRTEEKKRKDTAHPKWKQPNESVS